MRNYDDNWLPSKVYGSLLETVLEYNRELRNINKNGGTYRGLIHNFNEYVILYGNWAFAWNKDPMDKFLKGIKYMSSCNLAQLDPNSKFAKVDFDLNNDGTIPEDIFNIIDVNKYKLCVLF
jgi:hypothetical protein